jgi:hypothetical protein
MTFPPLWVSPPGYDNAVQEMSRPRYGWAVITSPAGMNGGKIAVLGVTDWEKALATMPYRWLNSHPLQPAPVDQTLALAEETYKARKGAAT